MWKQWTDPMWWPLILLLVLATEGKGSPFLVRTTLDFQTTSPKPQKPPPRIRRNKLDRSYRSKGWFKVAGYSGSKYFYGTVQIVNRSKVAGYVYTQNPVKETPRKSQNYQKPQNKEKGAHEENRQKYIYGKIIKKGLIQAFDKQGNLYRLTILKPP
ncbi:hypothetical protein MIN45_P0482 [Methylomarinovum tepidoasis]|uniref:Uncharacterized protein n=1 Tax=Methylomarinovum tepidoasis TaxID=2840183 RepID=A0AAU9BWU7_9GAMM|nr:hypothetical protein [Methylomarinovum sp. IN45]BCX88115.1 hypothetical protein MIN45_P0482 [Methylomarinovum sp. IN45]